MANNQILTTVQAVVDYAVEWGYPATALVLEVHGGSGNAFHVIWYGAAPSTSFTKAPNGSLLVDFVNNNFYIKQGTLGLANGTWHYVAVSS